MIGVRVPSGNCFHNVETGALKLFRRRQNRLAVKLTSAPSSAEDKNSWSQYPVSLNGVMLN